MLKRSVLTLTLLASALPVAAKPKAHHAPYKVSEAHYEYNDGFEQIVGLFENTSGRAIPEVGVCVNFYDGKGVLLDQFADEAYKLKPGQKWRWHMSCPDHARAFRIFEVALMDSRGDCYHSSDPRISGRITPTRDHLTYNPDPFIVAPVPPMPEYKVVLPSAGVWSVTMPPSSGDPKLGTIAAVISTLPSAQPPP